MSLSDFFSVLRKTLEGHPSIWAELQYTGGSPQQVRNHLELFASGTPEQKETVADLIAVAVGTIHFGTKPITTGLPASKAGKFSPEARAIMEWCKATLKKHSASVSGLTHNSVAAALPELSLVAAAAMGVPKPVPALLQLALKDSVRNELEITVGKQINPGGASTPAGETAARLQKENPMMMLHTSPNKEDTGPMENTPTSLVFNAVKEFLDSDTKLTGSDLGFLLDQATVDLSFYLSSRAKVAVEGRDQPLATFASAAAAASAPASASSPAPAEMQKQELERLKSEKPTKRRGWEAYL